MRQHFRKIDATATVAVVATGVLGLLVRHTLNPDGVAYLDLAAVLRRGDLHHFVQGYWSPLYPALLALTGLPAGGAASGQIVLAHLLNVAAVILTIRVIWRWSRTLRSPWFGRGAIAALVVCSAEPPRVEALTPDLILLWLTACIGYELVVYQGERWLRLGVLFGIAYLTKTGVWPWVVIAMVLRTAMAPAGLARRATLHGHLVTVALMLCWLVPMSVQAGRPTLGSTGGLNAQWYLYSSDARTPDTHVGEHLRYRTALANDSSTILWAEFDSAPGWTYHPWSNPDDWSRGVVTYRSTTPTVGWLLRYWAGMMRLAVSVWLRTLLVFVLIPMMWIGRRRSGVPPPRGIERSTSLAMLLGAIGVAEYIVIHAEPRLIAPFALLFTLAALDRRLGDRQTSAGGDPAGIPATIDRIVLSWVGVAAAVYVTVTRIRHAIVDEQRIATGLIQLEDSHHAAYSATPAEGMGLAGVLAADIPAHPRVVILGPALPVMANVFWLGGRIVAQLPPLSAASLSALTAERQRDLMQRLFHGRADVLWLTDPDGNYQIVHVP